MKASELLDAAKRVAEPSEWSNEEAVEVARAYLAQITEIERMQSGRPGENHDKCPLMAAHDVVPYSSACGTRIVEQAIDKLTGELEQFRADAKAAAGELLIDIPKPGTLLSKLLIANKLIRDERQELLSQLSVAQERLAMHARETDLRCEEFDKGQEAIAEVKRLKGLASPSLGVYIEMLRVKLELPTDRTPIKIITWAMHELNGRAQTQKLAKDVAAKHREALGMCERYIKRLHTAEGERDLLWDHAHDRMDWHDGEADVAKLADKLEKRAAEKLAKKQGG